MKWIKVFLFLGVLVLSGAFSHVRADWPPLMQARPWWDEWLIFTKIPSDSISQELSKSGKDPYLYRLIRIINEKKLVVKKEN